MPPDPLCPGLGAAPLGPSAPPPATVDGAVERGAVEVIFAVDVALPAELLVTLPDAELPPVADPDWLDWLDELGAEVMVDELLLRQS